MRPANEGNALERLPSSKAFPSSRIYIESHHQYTELTIPSDGVCRAMYLSATFAWIGNVVLHGRLRISQRRLHHHCRCTSASEVRSRPGRRSPARSFRFVNGGRDCSHKSHSTLATRGRTNLAGCRRPTLFQDGTSRAVGEPIGGASCCV